ncbi:uncharacterized protein UBRO_08919 [Ustilago bromivora]|uniref:BZIP domain-containing protein n=1 Tax=Ustilago bromivora TaxID=307758 RepID=A0A1K0GEI3_9BASI|nr:uncharacterized protein UBRO_08919 [Ustilago bromivora]SYW77488.1 uncharacterized protein UBRO2_01868 [Ustilago bromivora]
MAATQVARNSSFNGFDDLVNKVPSSPALQPRARTASSASQASLTNAAESCMKTNTASSSSSSTLAASTLNMRKVGLDENQPPPPPGSSPEVFFRYYLAVELRKAGTQPSEALLDRYVRNHFDSLFKNKGNAQQACTSDTSALSRPRASTSQVTVAAVARPPPPQSKAVAAAPAIVSVATRTPQHVAFAPVVSAVDNAVSPPELDTTAESPVLSSRSYSPVATPPILNSIGEDDALVNFSTVFGEPSSCLLAEPSQDIALGSSSTAIKFEDDSDQMLGFFRTSPFRTTEMESATIDPHVVESGAVNPFSMAMPCISPADLTTADLTTANTNTNNSCYTIGNLTGQVQIKDVATPMSEDDDEEHNSDEHGSGRSGDNSPWKGTKSKSLNTIPMAVGDINYLKPDPEEYKKLSSREKRQLRNKISARNFRTRRKEYITQLEEQISDRDTIIEGLRQQISELSVENKSLKEEVKTIKGRTISSTDVGKILEALQSITVPTWAGGVGGNGVSSGRTSPSQEMPLTPGALLNFGNEGGGSRPATPTLMLPGSPRSQSPRPSLLRRSSPSLMPQANTKKDVAPSMSSSFWGGVGGGSASSTFMPVC